MRSCRHHLGTGFEVWTAQQTWFWFVVDPHRSGGMIGAAATEAEAVREACLSIEAMSAQRRADAAVARVTAKSASMPPLHQFNSITLAGWESSLANLERYLTCVREATA
jgi:hypothetical protein